MELALFVNSLFYSLALKININIIIYNDIAELRHKVFSALCAGKLACSLLYLFVHFCKLEQLGNIIIVKNNLQMI
jgi:hypothetical protein